MTLPRVISLLPAATEIVGAVGMLDALVGVSHECDFPPEVNDRPRVTRSSVHGENLSSGEIDRRVRDTLSATGTLYTLDEELLHQLRPTHILTQQLCGLCAVDYPTVLAVAGRLPGPPQVINLEPTSLGDVLRDVRRVADSLGTPQHGEAAVAGLQSRIDTVRERTAGLPRRRCTVLEWLSPPFCAGHWVPELVEIAGGTDPVGRKWNYSMQIPWEAVRDAAPEVLVVACCGFGVDRTLDDLPHLRSCPDWDELPAVRTGDVYVADGAAYFSRPSPRLVDSIEILAELIHPNVFAGRFPTRGVVRVPAERLR